MEFAPTLVGARGAANPDRWNRSARGSCHLQVGGSSGSGRVGTRGGIAELRDLIIVVGGVGTVDDARRRRSAARLACVCRVDRPADERAPGVDDRSPPTGPPHPGGHRSPARRVPCTGCPRVVHRVWGKGCPFGRWSWGPPTYPQSCPQVWTTGGSSSCDRVRAAGRRPGGVPEHRVGGVRAEVAVR